MVILTGSIAYDFIIDFPGKFEDHILPNQLHKINLAFNVDQYAKKRGGTAANTCYTMQLLKTPSILFSIAGKDFDEYKEAFIKYGIDVSSIVIDRSGYTSTGFGITDKMNNQIWGYSYGVASKVSELKLKKVAKKEDLVVVGPSGLAGTLSFIKQSMALSLPYFFDPSFNLTNLQDKDLLFGLKNATYVIGNDYEMELIRSRVKDWRKIFEKKIIITTFGKKGAEIKTDGKIYVIKTAKPDRVVDPTGAGDAWRAGFFAGIERGYNLQVCGNMGSVAASFAIEHYGTQEHRFSVRKFQNRYRQIFKSLVKL